MINRGSKDKHGRGVRCSDVEKLATALGVAPEQDDRVGWHHAGGRRNDHGKEPQSAGQYRSSRSALMQLMHLTRKSRTRFARQNARNPVVANPACAVKNKLVQRLPFARSCIAHCSVFIPLSHNAKLRCVPPHREEPATTSHSAAQLLHRNMWPQGTADSSAASEKEREREREREGNTEP